MNKILTIAWKDLLILLQDRAALIFMLAAPFMLTLGMGAVSGAFSPSASTGIQSIPIVVVNQDQGPLGRVIVDVLSGESMDGLFTVKEAQDIQSLRREVEEDRTAAGIIIPAGYSASIMPSLHSSSPGEPALIEVYTNPVRPISSGIVQSVVIEAAGRVEAGPSPAKINLVFTGSESQEEQAEPNVLAYMAPAMAVFFLMYTASQGGRSILAERQMGTLTRMLASPTSRGSILAGKVLSIFSAGFLQVYVLVLTASLLFKLDWGSQVGVAVLIAAASLAATGWGILLASAAKSTAQVSSIGTALMLTFGVLGGSFISTSEFSPAVRLASKITPNAWAMDGFEILSRGGGPSDLAQPVSALVLMAALLFAVSVAMSRKRWTGGF
jgi:ABC-2 type transport system permease protein